MKFNTTQKDHLKSGFTQALQDKKELEKLFKENYTELYNEIIKDYLVLDGFPNDVDINEVDKELIINSDADEMVSILESRDVIEDEEQFKAVLSDSNFFKKNIIEVPMYLDINVTIRTTLEEYFEVHPTREYLAQKINSKFEEREFIKYIEQKEDIKKMIIDTAVEEGFSNNVDIDRLKYSIDSHVVGQEEAIANNILSKGIISKNNPVEDFVSNDLYEYIYVNRLMSPSIRIEQSPEEYEEL